jgi:hypothetical protein
MNERRNATKRPKKTAGAPFVLIQFCALAQRFLIFLWDTFYP